MNAPLEVSHLVKGFGGIPVLRDVSFTLRAGELTVLAGENGAGKSTLMKIVTGQLRADLGSVSISGTGLHHPDPALARELGVGIVPQELAPYPELTVYENLFVGRELRSRSGLLDRRRMASEARDMLGVLGVDLDPGRRMGTLSVALTQLVEIAKATTWGAKVILLDEPTSSIPEREVGRLYAVVDQLKASGVAMLYTTHRMEEIQRLADQVMVLRDGQLVLDEPIANTTPDGIVSAMIGRDLDALFPDIAPPQEGIGLTVRDLRLLPDSPAVNLQVRRGEILGIGGLVGAGRTEVAEAIFGMRRSHAGTIEVAGRSIKRGNPAEAIRAGVALVPEDRKGAGLVLTQSILDNGSLPHLDAFSVGGWLRAGARRKAVSRATESVQLKAASLSQPAGALSGGNQQKVVLARWLTQNVEVLVLDEPTRGVDVGARGEIYAIIRDLAAKGLSVLLISSDMPELIGLAHRLVVMRAGGIAGVLEREELDGPDAQESIFRLASGQHRDQAHVA